MALQQGFAAGEMGQPSICAANSDEVAPLAVQFSRTCAFSVLQSDRVAVRLEGQSSHAATDHAVRANVVEKRIDHVTPRRPICIPLDGHRDVINHDEHEEYYANHGQNLEKNIFMICHEIT
jgi:hypothetical protein